MIDGVGAIPPRTERRGFPHFLVIMKISRSFSSLCIFTVFAAAGFTAPVAAATDCAATVESNDAMQFNVKSIAVPASCKTFTITLQHVGKLPKAAMGHNLVLTKTADMTATAADGIQSGLSNDYLKPQDARVIAHTAMIGGGESASVELPVTKLAAGVDYSYFCTFPGHNALMKGTLRLIR